MKAEHSRIQQNVASDIGALETDFGTLGKSFKLFVPQFPYLQKGNNDKDNNNQKFVWGID